jgi:hypothetical protein
LTQSAQERLRKRLDELGAVRLSVTAEVTACPICGGGMGVQKTVQRQGRTLEHGSFEIREAVHVCVNGCRWPSGARVIERAGGLGERLLPRSTIGYDVMTFVGMERFLRFRQREEIQALLKAEPFRLAISTGEISRLERLFLEYLERLHDSRTVFLRAVLEPTAAGRCILTPPARAVAARCWWSFPDGVAGC